MASSEQLTKQILSRLGVEVKDENPQKSECPFDCSSKFSMLDEVSEDVYSLGSDLAHIKARTEAHGQIIRELGSHHRNLLFDHRQLNEDILGVREIIKTHSQRLDEIDKRIDYYRNWAYENNERIAKLEERAEALNEQLNEETRQRKKSDSGLGWLILGLFFLGLVSQQKPQTRASKELQYIQRTPATIGELAEMEAREYVQLRTVGGRKTLNE